MCARYTLTAPPEVMARLFNLLTVPSNLAPRYNIAPTQPVAIIRIDRDAGTLERRLVHVHWGLVPRWARDVKIASSLINARSETAAEKPSFRDAMKYRRCLIPANGFYEWESRPEGKQPWYVHAASGSLLALGGLWEHWSDAHGNELETCTILTTRSNGTLADLHDRMPVVIPPGQFDRWLDPRIVHADQVEDLLRPAPDDLLVRYPVSRQVNSPTIDVADCIEQAPELGFLF